MSSPVVRSLFRGIRRNLPLLYKELNRGSPVFSHILPKDSKTGQPSVAEYIKRLPELEDTKSTIISELDDSLLADVDSANRFLLQSFKQSTHKDLPDGFALFRALTDHVNGLTRMVYDSTAVTTAHGVQVQMTAALGIASRSGPVQIYFYDIQITNVSDGSPVMPSAPFAAVNRKLPPSDSESTSSDSTSTSTSTPTQTPAPTKKKGRTVHLLRRRWVIRDALGKEEVVEGPGVVGLTPTLQPTETFQYQSHTPLNTLIGTMHGSYTMMDVDTGETFEVPVGPVGLFPDPMAARGILQSAAHSSS